MTTMQQAYEEQRPRLLGLAQRMLGTRADAEDALQETWIRVAATDPSTIDNLAGWLTTVTSRVCLNVLRARGARPERAVDELPASLPAGDDPADDVVLADAVGVALLLVLEGLAPAERVAFVLHDMFAVPFDEIAPIVDRSVESTRQLASRARRRVRPGSGPTIEVAPSGDPDRRRELVDAFFAAAREGDLSALVSVLHPEVVLTADRGTDRQSVTRGAAAVAGRAAMFANPVAVLVPVDIDGHTGVLVEVNGSVVSLLSFVIADDVVVQIEAIADPERLATIRHTG